MKVDEVNGFRGGERPLIRDGASASGCDAKPRLCQPLKFACEAW